MNTLEPAAAVILDLDGVLLDSADAVRATLAAVATCALGRRVHATDLRSDALLRPRCAVLADLGVPDPDGACAQWWDPALAAATAPPRLFDGVLDGLHALRRHGAHLGLVTLQDRHRLPWLVPTELIDLLDVSITRHDARPKPAPDGIIAALTHLNVEPGHAVYVGDTPSDITAADLAGVIPIGVTWGYATAEELHAAGAARLLSHPHDLAELPVRPTVPKPPNDVVNPPL